MNHTCAVLLLLVSTVHGVTNAHRLTGQASYYHDRYEGRRTASGKVFRQRYAYAAHCTLPFGTRVRVHNLDNGRSWVVVIEDRGPFDVKKARKGILTPHPTRVIDVSRETARMLGFRKQGIANIKLEILYLPAERSRSPPRNKELYEM
jgi:rare lipoprotein A